MSDQNVSVIMCDDLRLEVSGKIIIVGMYPSNIVMPTAELVVPQLQFFFTVDFPRDAVPQRLSYEVELPGEQPQRSDVPVVLPVFQEGHTRWMGRHALTVTSPTLRPGKIQASVITDKGVFPAVAGWVVTTEMQAALISPPTA